MSKKGSVMLRHSSGHGNLRGRGGLSQRAGVDDDWMRDDGGGGLNDGDEDSWDDDIDHGGQGRKPNKKVHHAAVGKHK